MEGFGWREKTRRVSLNQNLYQPLKIPSGKNHEQRSDLEMQIEPQARIPITKLIPGLKTCLSDESLMKIFMGKMMT